MTKPDHPALIPHEPDVSVPETMTFDDFVRFDGVGRYELLDGSLVEKHMGLRETNVQSKVARRLDEYGDASGNGFVLIEAVVRLNPDRPNRGRKLDIAYVLKKTVGAELTEAFLDVPPELAVEIVSPNDLYLDVDRKIEEYLANGVGLVWACNADLRLVRTYAADGTVGVARVGDTLTGGDLLPGLSVAVADLFPN